MRINRKQRESILRRIARHGRIGDKQCTVCGSPTVIVDPDANEVARWCLCGDEAREAMGRPTLWEALIAMGEDDAAHEAMGNPFEPVTDEWLEREAETLTERQAERARKMRDVRKRLDDGFGLS